MPVAEIQKFEKEITVQPAGELVYYRRTGETYLGSSINRSKEPYDNILKKPNAALAQLVDAFLADEFIKPAIIDADYKITSALQTWYWTNPKEAIKLIPSFIQALYSAEASILQSNPIH